MAGLKERESMILAQSRIAIGSDTTVRLFRNNVGVFRALHSEEIIRCGLCPGSSDLIGWKSIEVTPDMVGQRVAIFVAAECKVPRSYPETIQRQFIQVVRDMGGRAGIFRSPAELLALTLGDATK